ncbi:hypothetical protein HDV05_004282 [Chytridiales sp. JEL 0842]|nr:hypothetical protein HDV05_004282 [Chytridiales sp. JEL 0842]
MPSPSDPFAEYGQNASRLMAQWTSMAALLIVWALSLLILWFKVMRNASAQNRYLRPQSGEAAEGLEPEQGSASDSVDRGSNVLQHGVLMLLLANVLTSIPVQYNCSIGSNLDLRTTSSIKVPEVPEAASFIGGRLEDAWSPWGLETVFESSAGVPDAESSLWNLWAAYLTETSTTPNSHKEKPVPPPMPPAPPIAPRCGSCLANSSTIATVVLSWVFFLLMVIWFFSELFAGAHTTLESSRMIFTAVGHPVVLAIYVITLRQWWKFKSYEC